jgi:hypothetical protein
VNVNWSCTWMTRNGTQSWITFEITDIGYFWQVWFYGPKFCKCTDFFFFLNIFHAAESVMMLTDSNNCMHSGWWLQLPLKRRCLLFVLSKIVSGYGWAHRLRRQLLGFVCMCVRACVGYNGATVTVCYHTFPHCSCNHCSAASSHTSHVHSTPGVRSTTDTASTWQMTQCRVSRGHNLEIKSELNLGNANYHSLQQLFVLLSPVYEC